MQTDDTLILGDSKFKALKHEELAKANITIKLTKQLSPDMPLIFNRYVLRQKGDSILLVQKGQGKKIELVDARSLAQNDQYKEQQARRAYIATICQPKAIFDLSIAAQHQEPTKKDIAMLNKRLQQQLDNLKRGIRYVNLDLKHIKLFVFVDRSFANNKDLSSQIRYKIILANETTSTISDLFKLQGNLVHYSSTKSKRVTRSVLALEVYGIVRGVNMAIAINTTIKMVTNQLGLPLTPIIVYTDSYSLYKCLVKLKTTKEKRLIIDIIAIRQSYKRRELTKIRQINS